MHFMTQNLTHEQIFIAVVEAGSFKQAGEKLDIDASLISRKVAQLETRLNVKLLNRSTKKSTLTEEGEVYFNGMRRLVEEQLALEQQISTTKEKPSGTLRVSAPHDFGAFFVAPVLHEMTKRYPSLHIELILSSGYEDLISRGIDVAIRIGTLPDSQLICQKLGTIPRVLVVSPSYIKQHGLPESPEQLESHQFIFYTREQAHKTMPFQRLGKQIQVKPKGRMIVNSVSAIRELVVEGAGMHLGPRWAFEEDLNKGKVISVLDEYLHQSFPMYAIYLSRAYTPAKTRKFIELMREQIKVKFLDNDQSKN